MRSAGVLGDGGGGVGEGTGEGGGVGIRRRRFRGRRVMFWGKVEGIFFGLVGVFCVVLEYVLVRGGEGELCGGGEWMGGSILEVLLSVPTGG